MSARVHGGNVPHAPWRVPYGAELGDRLWMWGHHAKSVSDGVSGIPPGPEVDMAEACRRMGIPGCAVVRWRNMPTAEEIPAYMRQFEGFRRVAFSVTDGAKGTFEEKVELGLGLAAKMPNLSMFFLDDFFVKSCGLTQPLEKIRALRERLAPLGVRLAVVLYADQDGVRPELKDYLDLCDEISFWFWNGRNVAGIESEVAKLRELVGPAKTILLGQYMWDFGARRPMPPELMRLQLEAAHRLLHSGGVQGLVFHCTPIVDRGLEAVRISREWIDSHAAETLPAAHGAFTAESQMAAPPRGAEWPGFSQGIGIGGWLTNYKRFNVLPDDRRLLITEGDLEHFDTYITERDVANIAAMGADHVRLCFDQIVLEEAPGRFRERTFRLLEAFAGWCERHGLNLVLNLHKAIGNYCDIPEKTQLLDDDALQRRFIDLWLEIERRFHDRPGIAFELLNEVRNVNPAKWNDLADRAIRAIRERNPGRWIVVGSTCWNSPDKLGQLKVWDDPRVVYTFHMYAPFEFTHQRGVLMAATLAYNRAMPYPTRDVERYRDYQRFHGHANPYPGVEAIDRDFLRGLMRGARDFIEAHPGKVLWNGEFGTIRHAAPECRQAYMRDVIAVCREWGVPYCAWNYLSTPNDGNRFSLVDDETRRPLMPLFPSAAEA